MKTPWILTGAATRSLRRYFKRATLGGFFEALTENCLAPGGKTLRYLERIRAN
jgi:hypothetical protein